MLIGFFVNDLEREYENYATTVLAHMAAGRGHRVCYITPTDFALNSDDTLSVHGRFLPQRKYKDRGELFGTLKDPKAIKGRLARRALLDHRESRDRQDRRVRLVQTAREQYM